MPQFCLFLPFSNYHFHSQSLHLLFLLCTNWYSMTRHTPLNSPSANVLFFTLEGLFAWKVSIQCFTHGHFLYSVILFPLEIPSHLHRNKRISTVSGAPLVSTLGTGRCFPFSGVQHSLACYAYDCNSFFQIPASSPQGSVLQKPKRKTLCGENEKLNEGALTTSVRFPTNAEDRKENSSQGWGLCFRLCSIYKLLSFLSWSFPS